MSPIKKTIVLNLNSDRGGGGVIDTPSDSQSKDQMISVNLQNPYQNLIEQQSFSRSRFIQRKPLVVSTPKIGIDVQRYKSLSHNTSYQNSARGENSDPYNQSSSLSKQQLDSSDTSMREEKGDTSRNSFIKVIKTVKNNRPSQMTTANSLNKLP